MVCGYVFSIMFVHQGHWDIGAKGSHECHQILTFAGGPSLVERQFRSV